MPARREALSQATLAAALTLLFIAAGCAGSDPAPSPTPIATAPAPTATSAPATATSAPTPATPAATLEDGQRVDVGGYRLWMRCWGAGTPTVIFDAPGPAADSSALGTLPEEVAAFTRVCVYDRAGQGDSDPGGPTPTTSAQQAAELATLLEIAGVDGPFIAAGYSWGGTVAYLLATTHPDVAGLVLIDAPNEDALREIAATQQVIDNVDFTASAEELAAATALGDIPLLVITRGLPAGPGAADFPAWQAQQTAWLERSSDSRQVIAAQSDHFDILETGLDVVVEAIEELVLTVRG